MDHVQTKWIQSTSPHSAFLYYVPSTPVFPKWYFPLIYLWLKFSMHISHKQKTQSCWWWSQVIYEGICGYFFLGLKQISTCMHNITEQTTIQLHKNYTLYQYLIFTTLSITISLKSQNMLVIIMLTCAVTIMFALMTDLAN